MAHMRWNLDTWLKARGVTRYALAKSMGGNEKSRLTTLYRMRDPQRIDLNVMAEIVSALRKLTGEDVTPNDLLEFKPDPEPHAEDEETQAWLDAPLAPPLEPYDWGDVDPKTLGQGQVRYVQGRGWTITDEQTE